MTLSSAAQSSFPGGLGSHYDHPLKVIIYYVRYSKFNQLRAKKIPAKHRRVFFIGSDQAPFCEGHDCGVRHDEVIEHLDINECQRLPKLVREHLVGP